MGKASKAPGIDVDWTEIILRTVDKASEEAPVLVFVVAVAAPVFLIALGIIFYYRHEDKKLVLAHQLEFEKIRQANRQSYKIIIDKQKDLPLLETGRQEKGGKL